jgi:hypothetical protein
MDILVGILLGVLIGFIAVSFYVLGLTHGRKVKEGSTVRLDPLKSIVDVVTLKETRQDKVRKEEAKEFNDKVKQMWEYNGVNK